MNNDARQLLTLGALNGFVAVALGAFGAHGLKTIATAQQLSWFETGTSYHMAHALVLLVCGAVALSPGAPRLLAAAYLFQLGILIFCATLYLMALGAPLWLGAITPIGGTLLLIAWLTLAWRVWHTGATD